MIGNEMKRFVMAIIYIRNRLIKSGKSHKNEAIMIYNINFLTRHLESINYSDEQLVKFFYRHSDKIFSLIPGEKNKCGKGLLKRYNNYYNLSKSLQPAINE